MPTEKIALGIFLAVVGALFALFASAYFMRMEFVDWRPMPLPRIVWLNTGMLVLASIALQCARSAVRQGDIDTVRLSLATAAVATLGFLGGQLIAWRELAASGYFLTGNPSNSFFYLLTGLHGLHILGGLVALARTAPGAWGVGRQEQLSAFASTSAPRTGISCCWSGSGCWCCSPAGQAISSLSAAGS